MRIAGLALIVFGLIIATTRPTTLIEISVCALAILGGGGLSMTTERRG